VSFSAKHGSAATKDELAVAEFFDTGGSVSTLQAGMECRWLIRRSA
jgi:hypothetical protein